MRISTSQSWSNALYNLQQAQERQNTANNQVSTQKVSTDLMGYGRSSEIIAAYQSSMNKTNSYLDVAQTVSDRLGSQDLALSTTSQSATDAKDSIMNALAAGDGTTLMQSLQGNFATALDGLNYEHNGQYLFSGGNSNTAPVNVGTLSQLAAVGSVASIFTNGTIKKTSQIVSSTTVQTGMLASDLGTALMQTFKDIQNFNDTNVDGPFGATLTDAQKAFLTTKSQEFSATYDKLTQQTSLNGTMQNRVTNTQKSLQGQADSLQSLIGDRTNADMAKAYSDLQQAQVAVQASAQVLSTLNNSSLLNYLK